MRRRPARARGLWPRGGEEQRKQGPIGRARLRSPAKSRPTTSGRAARQACACGQAATPWHGRGRGGARPRAPESARATGASFRWLDEARPPAFLPPARHLPRGAPTLLHTRRSHRRPAGNERRRVARGREASGIEEEEGGRSAGRGVSAGARDLEGREEGRNPRTGDGCGGGGGGYRETRTCGLERRPAGRSWPRGVRRRRRRRARAARGRQQAATGCCWADLCGFCQLKVLATVSG